MRLIVLATLLPVVLAISAQQTFAGVITTQPSPNGAIDIQSFELVGQTFTAEDSEVTIEFGVIHFNPFLEPVDLTVQAFLYEGIGTSGTLLKSGNLVGLSSGFSGLAATDFSSVSLTVGAVYTAILRNDTSQWLFSLGPPTYSGGAIISFGEEFLLEDGLIRVTPAAALSSVPEPGTLALFALGGVGLLARRLRKHPSLAK